MTVFLIFWYSLQSLHILFKCIFTYCFCIFVFQLSDTLRQDRCQNLLNALNSHKDRWETDYVGYGNIRSAWFLCGSRISHHYNFQYHYILYSSYDISLSVNSILINPFQIKDLKPNFMFTSHFAVNRIVYFSCHIYVTQGSHEICQRAFKNKRGI